LSEKELASFEYQMAEDAYLSELSENEVKQYYEKQYGTEQERRKLEAENGLDVRESNKESKSVLVISNEKETGKGNGKEYESSSKSKMVGERAGSQEIYRTAEASNSGGSTSPVLSIEEREDLESRGINPDWNKDKFNNQLRENATASTNTMSLS
jgi:hypothetical protein